MVSFNHWLSIMKTNTSSRYLTLVNANHASSNWALNDNCVMEVIMTDWRAKLIMLTEWTYSTLTARLKIMKRINSGYTPFSMSSLVPSSAISHNFSVTYGSSLSAIILALNFSKYHNTECGCEHRYSCYVQR